MPGKSTGPESSISSISRKIAVFILKGQENGKYSHNFSFVKLCEILSEMMRSR